MKAIVGKNYLKPEIKVIKIRQEKVLCAGTTGDHDVHDSRTLKSSFEEEE